MSNEFPDVENIVPQKEKEAEQDPVDLLKEKLQKAQPIEFEQEGAATLEEEESDLENVRSRIAGGENSVEDKAK